MSERLRLADHGEFFATRHAGRQLRQQAETLLDEDPSRQLIVDFAGVEAVTTAFADELVAGLVERYGPRIVLASTNSEVAETVERALARRH